jgi:hypothetical protein
MKRVKPLGHPTLFSATERITEDYDDDNDIDDSGGDASSNDGASIDY